MHSAMHDEKNKKNMERRHEDINTTLDTSARHSSTATSEA
jgi:hypothetical protein